MDEYSITPIGYIESPFDEKFAVPRQSSLIQHGNFFIHFYEPYCNEQAFSGIDEFSHLWVTFLFDLVPLQQHFAPMVRPPRLGGNVQKGVFATRSPFRPNRLGLSVVELEKVVLLDNKVSLKIKGIDVVNNTPVVDIKPYIKFVDAIPNACSGFASEPPPQLPVIFTEQALQKIAIFAIPEFQDIISDVLAQDPRPAYRHACLSEERVYGVSLCRHNVLWQVQQGKVIVLDIEDSVKR